MLTLHSSLFLHSSFWTSVDSFVFMNPRFSEKEKKGFHDILDPFLEQFPSHLFFLTSGTTSRPKWVALGKEAFLGSAQAVNQHLLATKEDRWLCVLPLFHVGGIGICARAYLQGASFFEFEKWNPKEFRGTVERLQITLSSLVPTQVYDLVQTGVVAPASLRAILVGGGALSVELYHQARNLGWPLLTTYGMTEASSQIATASLESLKEVSSVELPHLQLLPHLEIQMTKEGWIRVRGSSLLSAYVTEQGVMRPLDSEGWFQTEDRGEIQSGQLSVFGRGKDFVKILGENVNLANLRKILEKIRIQHSISADFTLFAQPHERLGTELILKYENSLSANDVQVILTAYHQEVLGFERIQSVLAVPKILRNDLGKVIDSPQA